jgi:hypothetical protein
MAKAGRRRSRGLGSVGRWAGAATALVLGAALVPNLAGATHANVFELDGNTADSPEGSPFDWTTFFNAAGARKTPLPASFVDSGFDADHAFPDNSTFTGGSKDTLDVSGWSCTDSNNLGGKFDIVNAYSTIYEVPAATGTFGAGDQLLFFGIERAATEGDGAMGFWFLKDGSVDCEKTSGGKAPAFTGNHKDGDIFVAAGFSNGGTQASVTAYLWKGGANGFLDVDNPLVTGALCGPTGSHSACGIVNTAEIPTDAGKPWPSPDKNGGALDVNAFYEGFVRVPVAQVTGCFATFVANTRSSTSPTSTIHDFSRGSFPTCRPSTTMTGLATPTLTSPEVVVGGASNPDTVTYTFREHNDGNVALTNVYVVTDNAVCNSTLSPASVATLATGATATFTCTVPALAAAGTTTIRAVGHGTSAFGDVTVCGTAALPFPAPTTAVCDAEEQDSAKSATIIPGTNLTVTRSPATVKQGDTITYTVVETNDGAGRVRRLARPRRRRRHRHRGRRRLGGRGDLLQHRARRDTHQDRRRPGQPAGEGRDLDLHLHGDRPRVELHAHLHGDGDGAEGHVEGSRRHLDDALVHERPRRDRHARPLLRRRRAEERVGHRHRPVDQAGRDRLGGGDLHLRGDQRR